MKFAKACALVFVIAVVAVIACAPLLKARDLDKERAKLEKKLAQRENLEKLLLQEQEAHEKTKARLREAEAQRDQARRNAGWLLEPEELNNGLWRKTEQLGALYFALVYKDEGEPELAAVQSTKPILARFMIKDGRVTSAGLAVAK